MKNKTPVLAGPLATIVYVGTVILGGAIRPGYSHIAQYVSELIAAGAPNKSILDPLFALYNLLVAVFGVGLYFFIGQQEESRRRIIGRIGIAVLVVEGLAGFLTLFFPQDPIGATATPTGSMHIVLAGISSVTSMLALLLLGLWLWVIPALHRYSVYTFISLAVIFVAGGIAATTIAHPTPYSGLMERITIGAFIQWLFVIGLVVYRSELKTTKAARIKAP